MEAVAPVVDGACSSLAAEDIEGIFRCLCVDDEREPVEDTDSLVFESLMSGRGLLIIAVLATFVL